MTHTPKDPFLSDISTRQIQIILQLTYREYGTKNWDWTLLLSNGNGIGIYEGHVKAIKEWIDLEASRSLSLPYSTDDFTPELLEECRAASPNRRVIRLEKVGHLFTVNLV